MKKSILFSTIVIILTLLSCSNKKNDIKGTDTKSVKQSNKEIFLNKIDSLTALIDKEPDVSSHYIKRAELWINGKRQVPANHDLKKALELEPENEKYLLAYGNHCALINDTRKSKNAWLKCIEVNPENTSCYLKLSELHFFVQDYEKSVSYANEVLKRKPDSHLASFFKGMSMMEFGDTTKAIMHFQNSLEAKPDFSRSVEMLATIYAAKNDELSIDYYKSLLNLQPTNKTIYFNIGYFYQKRNEFDKALTFYDLALKVDPDNDGIYYNKGYILTEKKEYDLAIDMFTKSIEKNQNSYVALFARGYIYELQNKFDLAFSDYSTVLILQPAYKPADEGMRRVKK